MEVAVAVVGARQAFLHEGLDAAASLVAEDDNVAHLPSAGAFVSAGGAICWPSGETRWCGAHPEIINGELEGGARPVDPAVSLVRRHEVGDRADLKDLTWRGREARVGRQWWAGLAEVGREAGRIRAWLGAEEDSGVDARIAAADDHDL